MDKIRMERKNWFYSYNMIFKQPISEHAKIVYLYLCRCADEAGQSFPSFKTIGENCSFTDRTAKKAVAELEDIGLLTKLQRFTKNGGKTSNLYTVMSEPSVDNSRVCDDTPCEPRSHTHRNDVPIPCEPRSHTHRNDVPIPCEPRSHKGLISEVLPNEVLPSEGAKNAPTHVQNVYGEYNRVRLTLDEYTMLVNKYGETKIQEYIGQLDRRIASEGKRFADHCATIEIWIKRDEKKIVSQPQTTKQNRFVNFKQRERDYAEIERMEREKLLADLKEKRPSDVVASEQAPRTDHL